MLKKTSRMMKAHNSQNNESFYFFIWQDFLHVFLTGGLISPVILVLLKLQDCDIKTLLILTCISVFTLRVVIIDNKGFTIKMLLLPIRKKLLYNQIVFIGYTRAVGSASILVKNNYYSWWKCFLYRIYLPTIKYQGNEKNTFILLSFIKEHYSKEIIPIGHGAEFLCKKVNDYYQENNVD